MPNIKPISDLRNYSEVLHDVAVGAPVFLTKNGRGRYAIVDIQDYEKTQARMNPAVIWTIFGITLYRNFRIVPLRSAWSTVLWMQPNSWRPSQRWELR